MTTTKLADAGGQTTAQTKLGDAGGQMTVAMLVTSLCATVLFNIQVLLIGVCNHGRGGYSIIYFLYSFYFCFPLFISVIISMTSKSARALLRVEFYKIFFKTRVPPLTPLAISSARLLSTRVPANRYPRHRWSSSPSPFG
jgi:hypothetical protein